MKNNYFISAVLLLCIAAVASGCRGHHHHNPPPEQPGNPGQPQPGPGDQNGPPPSGDQRHPDDQSSALPDDGGHPIKLAYGYKTYANDKLGYTAEYPDLFVKSCGVADGDGAEFKSASGEETLRICASPAPVYGAMNSQLKAAEAAVQKDSRNEIVDSFADFRSYGFAYDARKQNREIENVEFKTLKDGKTISVRASYPVNERESLIPAMERMALDLRQ